MSSEPYNKREAKFKRLQEANPNNDCLLFDSIADSLDFRSMRKCLDPPLVLTKEEQTKIAKGYIKTHCLKLRVKIDEIDTLIDKILEDLDDIESDFKSEQTSKKRKIKRAKK